MIDFKFSISFFCSEVFSCRNMAHKCNVIVSVFFFSLNYLYYYSVICHLLDYRMCNPRAEIRTRWDSLEAGTLKPLDHHTSFVEASTELSEKFLWPPAQRPPCYRGWLQENYKLQSNDEKKGPAAYCKPVLSPSQHSQTQCEKCQ